MKERTIRYRKMFKARHKSFFLDGLPTDENRKGLRTGNDVTFSVCMHHKFRIAAANRRLLLIS